MENARHTFTIKLHTSNMELTRDDIRYFINNAIESNELMDDLTYNVDEEVQTFYSFLNDPMAFSYFIRKTREDFLQEYPYFAEEYDFCLSQFNKHTTELLLEFLENTSTEILTEPYGLLPQDFSYSVGEYIKHNMTDEEKVEFLKLTTSKGLKVNMV